MIRAILSHMFPRSSLISGQPPINLVNLSKRNIPSLSHPLFGSIAKSLFFPQVGLRAPHYSNAFFKPESYKHLHSSFDRFSPVENKGKPRQQKTAAKVDSYSSHFPNLNTIEEGHKFIEKSAHENRLIQERIQKMQARFS